MTVLHPKTILANSGLAPKHHFGQNFLTDHSICEKIAALCVPTGTQTVIEIGAGLGALTARLVERSSTVIAIERDRDLVPLLRSLYAHPIEQGACEIVEADAKTFDYEQAYKAHASPAVLCGNLPYQLTGPLLRRTIELAPQITRATFLVQLEVADRLVAVPDSEEYGQLTVFLQARFAAVRSLVVRRGAFYPQPNVDSAVVVLTPLETPVTDETATFREVVSAAFAQRRKKLRNAWNRVAPEGVSLAEAAENVGVDLDLRGEVLTVRQFAAMAREIDRLRPASAYRNEKQ